MGKRCSVCRRIYQEILPAFVFELGSEPDDFIPRAYIPGRGLEESVVIMWECAGCSGTLAAHGGQPSR